MVQLEIRGLRVAALVAPLFSAGMEVGATTGESFCGGKTLSLTRHIAPSNGVLFGYCLAFRIPKLAPTYKTSVGCRGDEANGAVAVISPSLVAESAIVPSVPMMARMLARPGLIAPMVADVALPSRKRSASARRPRNEARSLLWNRLETNRAVLVHGGHEIDCDIEMHTLPFDFRRVGWREFITRLQIEILTAIRRTTGRNFRNRA